MQKLVILALLVAAVTAHYPFFGGDFDDVFDDDFDDAFDDDFDDFRGGFWGFPSGFGGGRSYMPSVGSVGYAGRGGFRGGIGKGGPGKHGCGKKGPCYVWRRQAFTRWVPRTFYRWVLVNIGGGHGGGVGGVGGVGSVGGGSNGNGSNMGMSGGFSRGGYGRGGKRYKSYYGG